jgi:hypothetical protein
MRIAVLVTGQPRFIEAGAWWLKNKVFPDHYGKLKVDYYCYFWDDGSPDLESRIVNAYNPVKYQIVDYNPVIDNFLFLINDYNSKNTQYAELASCDVCKSILYDTQDLTSWGRNFWGQYIATNNITNLVGDLTEKYDIVIKTRSDAVFNILSEQEWVDCFSIIHSNPVFNDIMFVPWMKCRNGVTNMGDLAFISKPNLFYQFSKNIYTNCVDLATKDKALFYELKIAERQDAAAHWLWNKISNYSKSNWLSVTTVGSNQFGVILLRENQNIQSVTYSFLEQAAKNYHMLHH